MEYIKKKGFFTSSNGHNDAAYYIYTPSEGNIRGIVQISHGMCEYTERYEDFIKYLCSIGFAVCGGDHIGHGRSVNSDDELGFFADKNGWRCLAADMLRLTRIAKEKFPGAPCFILGHSMGSLIERTVLAKHSDVYDGALILGTINFRFGMDAGLAAAESVSKLRGNRHRSKLLNKLMFGMSNVRIKDPKTEYDWICSDPEVVSAFASDPKCAFIFTVSAMYDLAMLLKYVSAPGWASKVRPDLPVFIAGGAEDPVGRYGSCPRVLFESMTKAGTQEAELHIYPGMRHEILNEKGKAEVYEDIGSWLTEKAMRAEAEM